jgi:hypothetical protein
MKVSGPATPVRRERRSSAARPSGSRTPVGLHAKLGLQSLNRFARISFCQDSCALSALGQSRDFLLRWEPPLGGQMIDHAG